tara:strand:- start:765 stop:1013 length:249 start_codon:yes stop_codon:yes gene_type:complete
MALDAEFISAYALRRAEKLKLTLSEDDLSAISLLDDRKSVRDYLATLVEKPVEKPKAKKTSRQKKSVKSSESDEKKQSESEE